MAFPLKDPRRNRDAYHKKIRDQNKRDGVCTTCRKQPAREGKTKCEECAKNALAYSLAREKRCKRDRLCYDCLGKLKPEWASRCPPCQQQSTENTLANRRLNV